MEDKIVTEATEIFRRLSPANQAYVMTLVRVAEAAEKGVKRAAEQKTCESFNIKKK